MPEEILLPAQPELSHSPRLGSKLLNLLFSTASGAVMSIAQNFQCAAPPINWNNLSFQDKLPYYRDTIWYNGIPGGLIGTGLYAIDELLISYDITEKHYLSNAAFWGLLTFGGLGSPLVQANLPQAIIKSYPLVTSAVVGAAVSYFNKDLLNLDQKLDIPIDSFFALNSLFDQQGVISSTELGNIANNLFYSPIQVLYTVRDDIIQIFNNPFAINVAKTLGLTLAEIALQDAIWLYDGIWNSTNSLPKLLNRFNDKRNTEIFSIFLKEAAKKALLITAPSLVSSLLLNDIYNDLSNERTRMLEDKQAELILNEDIGLRVASTPEGQYLLSTLSDNIYTLSNSVQPIHDAIQDINNILMMLYSVASDTPEIMIFVLPFAAIHQQIKQWFYYEREKNYLETLKIAPDELYKNKLFDELDKALMRNAEEFFKEKIQEVQIKHHELQVDENRLDKYSETYDVIKDTLQFLAEAAFYGYKFLDKQLGIDQILALRDSVGKLEKLLTSEIEFRETNKELMRALDKVNRFYELMEESSAHNIVYTENSNNKLVFDHFGLALDSSPLVNIEHLELAPGKIYVFTGKSGCGKSSVLKAVKSEALLGKLVAHGEISIPTVNGHEANILLIDQEAYLPGNTTLLETIYFPSLLPKDEAELATIRQKVINLLKAVEIDQFSGDSEGDKGILSRLDSKEFRLSGGQIKKITIIQAILSQPDILIMDETFTGLDPRSVIKLEQAIKTYLPDSIIISVDHHAKENNYNHFYDHEVHFENGTVSIGYPEHITLIGEAELY